MKEESTLKEKTKKKLEEMKALVEELNVQLHLGVAETKDEFEKQKKNLSGWVQSANVKLKEAGNIGEEKAEKLKASMESLRLQAALGKAESKEQFEDQQKKITKGINQVKHELSVLYDSSRESLSGVFDKASDKLDDLHTRFDLFRVQMHLGKEDSKDVWEEKKKNVAGKLNKITAKLKSSSEKVGDKLEDLTDEIAKEWKEFREMK